MTTALGTPSALDRREPAPLYIVMDTPPRPHEADQPISLHERAMDDLRFIRQTMERANAFTAVPGWGGVTIGVTALVASWIASRQPTADRWLGVWLATAVVAIAIAAISLVRKARQAGVPLSTGPGRTFLLSFLPPIGGAALLTAAIYSHEGASLLPGLWQLSYGAAIVAAGTFSVRIVPIMGIAFMATGALALITPATLADAWQAIGFGGLHIGFGFMIARRYGG